MTRIHFLGRCIAITLSGLAFGAAAQAAEITLYEHANFAGAQMTLRAWTRDFAATGFNDRASSIVVTSGRWELCTDADFRGTCAVFTRGEYPVIDGQLNDRISSAREVGSYGDRRGSYNDYGRGTILLFDQPGFAGQSLRLEGDTPVLARSGFNDRAASLVVEQGTWELCVDADFRGDCRTYAPGRYPDLGYGIAGQASSARLLRPAAQAPVVIAPGVPPVTPRPVVAPGVPPAPSGPPDRAVLYGQPGLRGASLALSGPMADLARANFDDATASLVVESGTWVACRDSYFRGECRTFGPGRYDDLGATGLDRAISSIRPGAAAPPLPSEVPSIELFAEADFSGERIRVDRDIADLVRADFNDRAASVFVRAGVWEVCTDARFGGSCAVLQPGRYPRLGGLTQQISSVRRVQ